MLKKLWLNVGIRVRTNEIYLPYNFNLLQLYYCIKFQLTQA
jgi:hypothetical protein